MDGADCKELLSPCFWCFSDILISEIKILSHFQRVSPIIEVLDSAQNLKNPPDHIYEITFIPDIIKIYACFQHKNEWEKCLTVHQKPSHSSISNKKSTPTIWDTL